MDKTREEFITWLHVATADATSGAYRELYSFLVNCFTRADKNFDGKLSQEQFDEVIEEAAAMPRKYGYAPVTASLYPTEAARKTARAKQFKAVDKVGQGYVSLDQWITFAMDHIFSKVDQLPKDYLSGTTNTVNKAEFITFIKKAVVKGNPEYKQLYHFLLKTFQNGDVRKEGRVNPEAFDRMIEAAAAAPRRFGLAPKSEEMFPNAAARLEKRKEYFAKMDADNNGTISFDEWLSYAMEHIAKKAATV